MYPRRYTPPIISFLTNTVDFINRSPEARQFIKPFQDKFYENLNFNRTSIEGKEKKQNLTAFCFALSGKIRPLLDKRLRFRRLGNSGVRSWTKYLLIHQTLDVGFS